MAGKKKRSSAANLTLMPVDLRKRRRIRVYTSLAVVFALLAAWIGGDIVGRHRDNSTEVALAQAEVDANKLRVELQTARDELALLRTGSQVAQEAQDKVRGEIRELRGQIAELEEAVAFYKNVMSPGSGEQGLRIEKLDLAAGKGANVINYRLVLTQVGDNRRYLSGDVKMMLAGRRGEEAVEVPVATLLASGSETRFKFRYYQELTGSLTLPEDVVAEQITVKANVSGRDNKEKSFIWQMQETSSAWSG